MKIPLSQGKFAIVGPRDYKYLMQWKWCYSRGYAVRTSPGRQTVRMHRVVLERMGFKNFEECDHINRDKLDNRRSNLRPVTHQQNMHNRNKPRNNTSGRVGVYWHQQAKKWQAQICINGNRTYLGLFNDKKEAIRTRDEFARKYYGEFAALSKE